MTTIPELKINVSYFDKDGKPNSNGIQLIRTLNELIRRSGNLTGISTVADAGPALAPAIKLITDESGGSVLAYADGAGNWRRVTDRAIIT